MEMRFKLNRLHKLIICSVGLLSVCSLLATSFKVVPSESFAASVVEGNYAKASGDSTLDNITFDLAENTAPQDSTKYKTSTGSLKILKENGTLLAVEASVEALTKTSSTKYKIASSTFSGIGGLAVGDTVILDGDFVRDDCTLHIKESKLYVYTQDSIVTVPHKVTNITSYLDGVRKSKDVQTGHNWAFLLWPEDLPLDAMLITGEDGYYPTSVHNIYVDGVAHANCRYDALRRRDDWGTEIFVCADSQIGVSNPAVGTLVVIDGIFNYKNYVDGYYSKNPHVVLEPGESFGIEINLFAMLKVGTGKDDYKQVDLKSYLVEQFDTLYNADLYEPENYEEINNIHNHLKSSIQSLNTAKEIYGVYNNCVAQMEAIALSEDGFDTFKEKYIKAINSYVDASKYYNEDQLTIQGYIDECVDSIEAATTTKDVQYAVELAKSQINTVKTRVTKMEEVILSGAEGFEDFLASYDNVTLNDLSLGNSVTFNGRKNERATDLNTNAEDKNQFNMFSPNADNKSGNVSFNFKYKSNAVPTAESNMVIVLRGVKYLGYKFHLGTDSRGFMFTRTFGSTYDSFEGKSNVFTNPNEEYNVTVSAIDLIEGGRTWIRLTVNGVEYLNKIVDSLSFCINPRVSLASNGSNESDVEGTTVITNYYPSTESNLTPFYCGRFDYESGHSGNNKTMYLNLEPNALKYEPTGLDSYALDTKNIKLIRDDEEIILGRSDVPILGKYSENSYQLYLSKLFTDEIDTLYPGDIVVISGCFAYFDTETSEKVIFEVGTSTFVFKGTNKAWTADVTLEDAKSDAFKKFNYYGSIAFQDKYDEDGKQSINNLIEGATILINQADTVDKVIHILSRTTLAINGVKTAFEKYQDQAIESLNSYKKNDYNLYREEELDNIVAIKDEATSNIKKASSNEEIDAIQLEAKSKIDAILTSEQIAANELREAIYQQITEIKNRYASLIKDSMSKEEIEKLNSETLAAIERVKAAKSIEEVNSAANEYLSAHPLDNVKNNTALIIIIAASAAVLFAGAGVASYYIVRKRKKAKISQ